LYPGGTDLRLSPVSLYIRHRVPYSYQAGLL